MHHYRQSPLRRPGLGVRHAILLATASIALAHAAPCSAQTAAAGPSPFYAQVSLGASFQSSPDNAGSADLNGHGQAFAWRLGAGMHLAERWSAELNYVDQGRVGIDTPSGRADYDTRLATLVAVYAQPLTSALSIVGRAGLGFTHSRVNVDARNYSSTSNKFPIVLGAGLRYALTPRWALTVDYDYFGKTGRYSGGDAITGAMLGAGLMFSL